MLGSSFGKLFLAHGWVIPATAVMAVAAPPEAQNKYDPANGWYEGVECRIESRRSVGFQFTKTRAGRFEFTVFNEDKDFKEEVPPGAIVDFNYSESKIYIKHFTRYRDSGLYSEFVVGKFIDPRRPLALGVFVYTEAFYSKDSTGQEVESLSPISKNKVRCTPLK